MINDTKSETIRRAGPDDAETLSAISASTFAGAFADLYWPHDLEAFQREAYAVEKSRRELTDPGIAVWLAERDGVAIGYALAGRSDLPHPDVTPE